ncbi:hypothetical protein SESBI_23904 [Sesbania bispinosa]|nr:hypothetical protein SESBI_23904 [Sesbania bispinosa]
MMHRGGNAPFTVIYPDGDKEINLGTIVATKKSPSPPRLTLPGYGSVYYFFVKSSRQSRKSLTSNKTPPQNVVLLRREAVASTSGGVDATPWSQTLNDHHGGGGGVVCEVCLVEKLTGNDSDFHLCVLDNMIEGFFRSTTGPVSRTARNSDEYYYPLFGGRWFSFMEA